MQRKSGKGKKARIRRGTGIKGPKKADRKNKKKKRTGVNPVSFPIKWGGGKTGWKKKAGI